MSRKWTGLKGRLWRGRGRVPPDALSGTPYPPLVRRLLWLRGVRTPHEARIFLGEERREHDPWLLPDVDRAVERLCRAIAYQEPIAIFGDFDVDGVTAAALLWQAIEGLGGRALTYIPDRLQEGYGLNVEAVRFLKGLGARILLAADCGTTAVTEVATARAMGLDVIVLDHHSVPPELPQGAEVVNPKRRDSHYPHGDLASVGLAFKVAAALYEAMARPFPSDELLDLVALGTVTDLVPLVGENRWLVQEGLRVLRRGKRIGLCALAREAGLDISKVDGWAIGWVLGPRLNAAGRLSHANRALRLLLTRDEAEAVALAQELDLLNRERQKQTDAALALSYQMIGDGPLPSLIFVGHEDFSLGVVGLVASRLCEQLYRPTFVYAVTGETVRASGRSIPQLDLASLLWSCGHLFVKFGGHRQAAGFTALRARLKEVEEGLQSQAAHLLKGIDLTPTLEVDAQLPLNSLRGEILRWLQRMDPYGPGNPEPVFLARGVQLVEVRPSGPQGRNCRLKLRDGDVVWSGLVHDLEADSLPGGGKVDIVYSVGRSRDSYGAVELKVHDLAPASTR